MDHRIFEDRYLLHLNDSLNMLPSIKPRKAHTLIKNWQDQLFEQMLADTWSDIEKETYKIKVSENLTIQSNDFEHIFFGDGFSTKRITPYGAKIICQAYKNGLFETKVLMQEFLIPLEVQEYIDSTDSILDKQNTDASRRKKAKDEYKQKISQLELINESDLTQHSRTPH